MKNGKKRNSSNECYGVAVVLIACNAKHNNRADASCFLALVSG